MAESLQCHHNPAIPGNITIPRGTLPRSIILSCPTASLCSVSSCSCLFSDPEPNIGWTSLRTSACVNLSEKSQASMPKGNKS